MAQLTGVAIVVPARDEEVLLGGCLRAITLARRRLGRAAPQISSVAVLVLDDCTDGSAAVAAQFPDVVVVHSRAGMVGAARSEGVAHALDLLPGPPASCWIASTDADSVVPPNWLVHQLTLAQQGAELVLGTVVPDRRGLPLATFDQWLARNPQHDGHPYVHGANLGIRGDAYLQVGGFAPVAEHEDAMLAKAVRESGGNVVATAAFPVATSGRMVGRTPGGLAGYLAALAN